MRLLYELSWLWKALGAALAAAAVCPACAMLICRAQGKRLGWRAAVLIGAAALVTAALAVVIAARIPALI